MEEMHDTNPEYENEIIDLLNQSITKEKLDMIIRDYHDGDIADALEALPIEQRKQVYAVISDEQLASIFAYFEDVETYLDELDITRAANIVSKMDSDDAVDVLDKIDDDTEDQIVNLMDEESSSDIKLIQSYSDDEIGSKMTTNFIVIKQNMSIKEAMKSLIQQASENDNISTIYVEDDQSKFAGAINLKDLIIARENSLLTTIITTSYPTVYDHESISELLLDIKDYSEDSIPVLNAKDEIIGIITAQDVAEVIDQQMSEDYVKFAALSSSEDLEEKTTVSVKKRMPWLLVLLVLGLGVSSVVGIFEKTIQLIPLLICFQSLILDMAGNIGTQSLAVTIRVLTDDQLSSKEKVSLIFKEVKVGFCNGFIIALLGLAFTTLYVAIVKQQPFSTAIIMALSVAATLLIAMSISSFIGTTIPIILNKFHVDPAVASGPLITSINDLVAVIIYYSLSWFLLVDIFKLF